MSDGRHDDEPHIGADDLALLALGEPASDVQAAHLAVCERCSSELDELAVVSSAGRDSAAVGILVTPHPRVWAGIAHQLDLGTPALHERSAVRRRRVVIPLLAAAAIAAIIAIGVGTSWALRPVPQREPSASREIERAILVALPSWPGASGQARVDRLADGQREVTVRIAGLKRSDRPATGEHEVWLLASGTGRVLSLGVLTGNSGSFPIPNRVDLSAYDLVDVSEEPRDGNPAHSGNSIVRGPLAPQKAGGTDSSLGKAGHGDHRSGSESTGHGGKDASTGSANGSDRSLSLSKGHRGADASTGLANGGATANGSDRSLSLSKGYREADASTGSANGIISSTETASARRGFSPKGHHNGTGHARGIHGGHERRVGFDHR